MIRQFVRFVRWFQEIPPESAVYRNDISDTVKAVTAFSVVAGCVGSIAILLGIEYGFIPLFVIIGLVALVTAATYGVTKFIDAAAASDEAKPVHRR